MRPVRYSCDAGSSAKPHPYRNVRVPALFHRHKSEHEHLCAVGVILPLIKLLVLLSIKYLKRVTKCLVKEKAYSDKGKEIK